MAATAAVFQFGDGVQDLRRIDFLVRIRFEAAGVAASAVRRVGAEFPGDHFVVAGVAVGADDAGAVRFVKRRAVRIGRCRCPCRGAVAGIATAGGDKVIAGSAGCLAAVMAAIARARRNAAVTERCWQPCRGAMTDIAGLAGR